MESKKLVCRKCNGNHLTIKCGKTGSSSIIESTTVPEEKKSDFKKEDDSRFRKEDGSRFRKEDSSHFRKEEGTSERVHRFKKEDTNERTHHFKKEGGTSFRKKDDNEVPYKRTINKVKIGQLPKDMTDDELNELLYDWGTIKHLRVLNYPENPTSTAYVEFRFEDEVDYLIKALDKTPFDSRIITVEKLNE
jgi:hypothetical protein